MKAILALIFAATLAAGCTTVKENPELAEFAAKQIFYRVALDEPGKAYRVLSRLSEVDLGEGRPLGEAIRERLEYDAMDLADRRLVDAFIAALGRRVPELGGERREWVLDFVEEVKADLETRAETRAARIFLPAN